MPADLIRHEVEQRPMFLGHVFVLVSEIHPRTTVASHLSHSIAHPHWKDFGRGPETNTCTLSLYLVWLFSYDLDS